MTYEDKQDSITKFCEVVDYNLEIFFDDFEEVANLMG